MFIFVKKHIRGNCGKYHKGILLFLPQKHLNNLNHMANTKAKDVDNFTSQYEITYLKNTHEFLNTKL